MAELENVLNNREKIDYNEEESEESEEEKEEFEETEKQFENSNSKVFIFVFPCTLFQLDLFCFAECFSFSVFVFARNF